MLAVLTAPSKAGELKRILVVDDNQDLREALKRGLEAEGYSVRLASHGEDALRQQRAEVADVLITDIFMPESDGFELLNAFRSEYPATRLVVISGDSRLTRRDYLRDAALLGVDAALRKPFGIDELLSVLGKLRAS